MSYFNAEDDLWFDFSVPSTRLAPGWRWEWTVKYPISRVDYLTIPPQSFREMVTPITDVDKFRAAFPKTFQQLDQQPHMGLESE